MNITTKTYDGLCVVSAVASAVYSALFAFKISASYINMAALGLFCVAMLFLIANKQEPSRTRFLAGVACVLMLCGALFGAMFRLGLLAWPCFAMVHVLNKGAPERLRMCACAVVFAGGVLLLISFFALPLYGAVALAVLGSLIQGIYAYSLFQQAKKTQKGEPE